MTATRTPSETGSPFLDGNYAPVQHEVTATDLEITGTVPEYLDGRYLRIGPNPLGYQDPSRYQVFMGEGMAHGLRLRGGRALWYRNRWVRSADLARRLGESARIGPHYGGNDFAGNTNIIGHGGRTLALTEAGVRPYELSEELDTVAPSDFCGTLFGGYSAHPKCDPATGELHAVSYNPLRGNIVQYTVTGVDGKVRHRVDIRLDAQTMMHDFSLTEKYVVLYDLSVALDLSSAVSGRPTKAVARRLTRLVERHASPDFVLRAAMRGSEQVGPPNIGLPYRWAPERPSRVGLMPRDGTAADIRWFEVRQPCFVFHPLNAYDDGDTVVLDIVRYPSIFASGPHLVPGDRTLDRWTVDIVRGTVSEERIDDTPQEFPRVDERLVGRRHRYGYVVGYRPGSLGLAEPNALLKHDSATRTTQSVSFGPGREPGEFVFVPTSPDAAEDDGIAMGFVYDRASDRSDLVLLDAATLETVGTVHIPARVPHGFHGNWAPTQG
ncbi:lignostilbene-alpha,beta-dioxygenase-like protein [Mycobacteroides abscessus subsp. massiliense]|uniref:carotenoid oxygenase family protein n=1 Tax=Mycobacteroides abscessus TaxID=36809 RepID=UPI0009A900A3|nr:carotenoid oxygenase family protein [Mycobacteroides abscessus]SLI05311.1 lignostilbene-alpha,beta-dioxygenase-like protein [Mycobacteroides abscessus subsp. massiliense]SLI60109.1 lignostilbene-alpha,beta-dioxygenase-like protein [Mycobacteroides abscessus subsp. massiliense]